MDVKRVLYLSYDGMTDPLGQSQVLPYLAGLAKHGYRFSLVSFEKSDRFQEGKETIDNICKENNIDWYPLPYTKSPPVLSTLKDLRAMKKKIRDLQAAGPFLLVHCRSYITALVGLWMKKNWQVKMIFDMRGFWANERIDGGIWNLRNPVYKIVYNYFKDKELRFLQQADHIISLTENAKQEMQSWKGSERFAPVEVIPCCVDIALFDPAAVDTVKKEQLRNQLDIQPAQAVLSYIGSIGTWYMLDEMLDFFKTFLGENRNAILLFVTKENKADLQTALQEKGIADENYRIIAAERRLMPAWIAISDYSLFFIKPAYSKKASSPTKQGEIMAMGIPLVCNDNVGDTSFVVNKYDAGVVVKEFSDEAYKRIIRQLHQADFNKTLIREGAADFFSLEKGVQKYLSVYKNLLP